MNLYRYLPALPSSLLIPFLLLGILFSTTQVQATHVMGADLTYDCLGGNQYEFTLTLYRDCDGTTALPAFNLDISSASCNQTAVVTVTQVSVTDISPICPALIANSSCNGGPISGVERLVYRGTYTLPMQCTDWVISWLECCRNNAITNANIISIGGPGFGTSTYIEATLDNLTVSCNSSPSFTNIPTPYVCAGELFQYNHGAFDADGDSLAYELIDPLDVQGTPLAPTPVNYTPPFSATYPVSTTPANSFGFDPLTGQLNFTPDVAQRGITAILVKEYRNGKLIGTTMRDIQIVVQNCTNSLPVWGTPTAVNGGTLNGQVFTVCAGNTLTFTIGASDTDAANSLAITSNLGNSIPASILNSIAGNPASASFSWTTSAADVGIHPFTLTVEDDACPIFGRQTVGFEIYVQGPVEVTASDQTVCPGTPETIQLTARVPGSPGNGTYTWTPTTGLSNPNIAAPTATISEAITYTVNYSEGICASNASVDIIAVGDLSVTPDTSICAPATIQLGSNFTLNLPPPPAICGPAVNTCGGPATTSTVGTGTQATGTLGNAGGAGSPFLGAYANGRTQLLFRASELNAAGVTPGIISALDLDVSSLFSTGGYAGFTISMGCTGVNELTGYEAGLTQVFAGTVTPIAGINTFPLTTLYEWDGSSNLIVEFCYANAGTSGYDHVNFTSTSFSSVFFGFSNATAGCNLTTGFPTSQRPNVGFTSCPLAVTPTYSWAPGAGLSSTTDPNPTANITGTQNYVLSVTTPGCVFTDTASIELAGPPVLDPFTDVSICEGDTVLLVPTGTNLTGTYSWTPAGGLSATNVLSPEANPTVTTAYTLTVTNSCGTSTETITITVNPLPQLTPITKTDISCFGANDGTATLNVIGGTAPFTYSWNPAAGITQTVTNLGPGLYTGTVTDANSCSSTGTVTIIEPPQLTLTFVSSADPSCNGVADGTITVTATGGTPAYEYSTDGVTFQPGATLTGLTGGTYTITVRDANLCTATVQVVITDPLAVGGNISTNTASDCLLNTGAFTILGEGGAGLYTYSLNGGPFQASGSFTGLGPGQYTVTVMDQNGCTGTVIVNVSAINAPTGSLNGLTNVLCAGNSTGGFSVSALGGTPPYQFSIDGGATQQATGTFSNLPAGTYSVQITDANGCPGFFDVTITEPAPLTAFISSQNDVTCPGGNDGAFVVFGNGGTPGYQYSINGVTFTTQTLFNNLTSGTYTVTVRDANLCDTTLQVVIGEPAPVSATVVAQTNIDCNGASTGSFTVAGTGGNGTYTYSLDGINFQNSGAFTNLPAGLYTVTINDIANCSGTFQVTITQPAPLVGVIVNQNNTSCAGDTDGSVELGGNGGTPGYTYSQDGITFSTNTIISGLAPGPYTFFIQDANGCQSPISVTITSPPAITLTVAATTNVSCNGLTDGTVTFTPGGGTPVYQYSLDNGLTFLAGPQLTGLAAGAYTAIVEDVNGCQATATFTLTEPTPVVVTVPTASDVTCFGQADGSFSAAASGGNGGAYTYSIDGINFQAFPNFTGLTANTYTVTARDVNGCEGSVTVTINEPPQIGMILVQNTPVTCPGGNDGQLTLAGFGGTVAAPGGYTYSINAGPAQASGTFSNLAAGTYVILVQDDNGCFDNQSFTVTEPQPLGLSVITQTDVTCFGGNDGGVTLTGSGGTPGYLFSTDGINFQANGTFNNLAAGPFTLTIQDANGCIGTASVTINEPPQIGVQINTLINVSCFGDSTGSISVTGVGGTPGYLYGLVGGPGLTPLSSYTGIPAGIYPLIIEDANACRDTFPITITQPAPIGLAIDSTQDVLCNAGTSGIIYLSTAGGTGPFSYSVNGGAGQNNPTISGLGAGPYQVIVTDAGGCQDSVTTTLAEPAALVVTPGPITNVTCPGGNDGASSVTANGGTPGYTYNWTPSGVLTPAANGLAAGVYSVDVTDANGCVTTETITITEPAPLTGNIQITQPISCFGLTDAAAVAAASGGTPGYTYTWSAGTAAGPSVTNLPPGTHFLTITDALGCTGLDSVTIAPPTLITISIDSTNISCNGFTDGTTLANPLGGAGGFTFVWNNDPTLNTANLTGLAAGQYTVVATDANGCMIMDTVTLTQPPAITTIATGINETCTDSNGELYALSQGGAGNFNYLWNTSPPQSGDTLIGIPAGTYQVIAVDQNGCQDTADVTILDEAAPTLQTDLITPVTCFGGMDGGAQVSAAGGTGIYTFSWNSTPVQTGPVLSNVAATTYQVTVDDGQCTTTIDVTVPEPPQLLLSILSTTDPSCNALSDGSIVPAVTGGTPGYVYSWNSIPVQNDSVAANLPEGSYQLVVVDRNGCIDSITATLTAPEALMLTITPDSVTCFGEMTGVASASVTGGTQPYTYVWSGTTASGPVASNLGVGVYGLSVIDDNGCNTAREVTIFGPDELTLEVIGTDLLCYGGSDGTGLAIPAGGTPPYSYLWSSGDMTNNPRALEAGTWTVNVTDDRGCTIDGEISLIEPDSLILQIVEFVGAFCDLPNGEVTVQAAGGTPGYTYSWNTSPAQIGPRATGIYGDGTGLSPVVTITDLNGCTLSDTILIPNEAPAIAAFTTANLDPSQEILLSEADILFDNQSQFAVDYQWDFGDGGSSGEENPLYRFPSEGQYLVTLTAWDANFACPDTASLLLTIVYDGSIFIPNAFSPNGDGSNDIFYFFGEGIRDVEVSIFDRWGKKIAILNSPAEGWDGTMIGGGRAQEGVYVYKMEGTLNNGADLRRGGTITLVR